MSPSARTRRGRPPGARRSERPTLAPTRGRTRDGLRAASGSAPCVESVHRHPRKKTPRVVSARRTRLRDGASASTASASSSTVRGSGPRISAMPSRATTWTDWTTNGPGQIRSRTLGIGFLHCSSHGSSQCVNHDPLDPIEAEFTAAMMFGIWHAPLTADLACASNCRQSGASTAPGPPNHTRSSPQARSPPAAREPRPASPTWPSPCL